jgi:hypothetical protein
VSVVTWYRRKSVLAVLGAAVAGLLVLAVFLVPRGMRGPGSG